ncbi:MAG TPA: metalloregulator ArsR/SmtB family transcription factor [Candidatus Saccharimonadales bacterium]|nr:metalloregulator ArsR/SmtB family transcription factor [Candidatus Saccharimonadales bacterium]
MVNDLLLDSLFHSLADPIRRDILMRVADRELSVGELVSHYNVSFVAISKHIKVLAGAKLIHKRKEGRKYMVALNREALAEADKYLEQYRRNWESSYKKLDALLKEGA